MVPLGNRQSSERGSERIMGKIADAIVAIIILILALVVFMKLGITFSVIWHAFIQFWQHPSPTNSTSVILSIGIASTTKIKEKKKRWAETMKRMNFLERLGILRRKRGDDR